MVARRSPAWERFITLFGATAALSLIAGVALVARADPFWVLRERPPWYERGGGVNRFLDVEMRHAKSLQVQVRAARAILVGSSTVYRGIDPADARVATYNAGVSSLMAAELPTLARLIAARRDGAEAVVGLDYYMFTRRRPPFLLARDLSTPAGRAFAWASAFVSLRVATGSSTAGILRILEPGAWHRDGFKTTPDFSADITRRVAASQPADSWEYEPDRIGDLDEAVTAFGPAGVRLYLSPMSAAQRRFLDEAGRSGEFERWRRDVAALAERRHVPFADLVDGHPFDDFDPARGSSRFWIDSVHFKPEVGRWVLRRLGLGQ
jgi:hypothetical protein